MKRVFPGTPRAGFRFAVGMFFFLQGLVFASWASRIPDIRHQLGLNDAELGGVLFALPCGQMAAMALSGYLVGRFGSRRMLLLAGCLYPVMLVGLGLAGTVWQLWLTLALFGVVSNLHNISVNTQAVGVERLYRRSIMATFHGLWSLAGFVGGIVGAVFAGMLLPPFVHFVCILAFALGVVLILHKRILPRDAAPSPQTSPEEDREPAARGRKLDSAVVLLGVIAFGCMASEGAMYDWSSVYFETVIQPDPEFIRTGYIVFMCFMVCGRFLADGMVTRFGAVRVLQASGVLIAAGLLIASGFPTILPASAGLALVGLGTASVVPLCYSLAGRSSLMRPGAAIALVSTIGFLGFLLCPPVIGFAAHAFGLRPTFAAMAMAGLLTALLAPFVRQQRAPR